MFAHEPLVRRLKVDTRRSAALLRAKFFHEGTWLIVRAGADYRHVATAVNLVAHKAAAFIFACFFCLELFVVPFATVDLKQHGCRLCFQHLVSPVVQVRYISVVSMVPV